jgi:hypothetical protein
MRRTRPNDIEHDREVNMPYKLVAAPQLLPAGDFQGHLETVTFIAANENESHKWWAVNVGTFEKDFTRIVSPELAQNIVYLSTQQVIASDDPFQRNIQRLLPTQITHRK